jgi:hypothetical protein
MAEAYVCCFCGKDISQSDADAIQLIATNLWDREAAQALYAHSTCASERMARGYMTPSALRDTETGYSLEDIVRGENEGRQNRVPGWTCLVMIIGLAVGAFFLLR